MFIRDIGLYFSVFLVSDKMNFKTKSIKRDPKDNVPKLNEEAAENLNRPGRADKIEAGIKKLPAHKSPGPDGFTGEFYKAFKEKLTAILHKLFEKIQTDGRLPNFL